METFRFAFFVMSSDYDPDKQHAHFETPGCESLLYGVRDLDQACQLAARLAQEGTIRRIELCGAFGPQGAAAVERAGQGRLSVGYVTDWKGE